MAVVLLSKIEAAITLGVGMALLEYFCKNCPKKGDDRILQVTKNEHGDMVSQQELLSFQHYLNKPWPLATIGDRPRVPDAIMSDIRMECHLCCAICGSMDNGEVAHIEAVAHSLNNSPDNLILLCPSHHSKYDLGYKPASNVTIEEIRAAKLLKRCSRQRMMKYEDNFTRRMKMLLNSISEIESNLADTQTKNMASILRTEAKALIEILPELTKDAKKKARNDEPDDASVKLFRKTAPNFAKAALGISSKSRAHGVRSAVTKISAITASMLADLDEESCPRCNGMGITGLVGDYCAYCHGDCFVTKILAEKYNSDSTDQVDCPHCNTRGVLGYDQHWCPFCKGSCYVNSSEAEDYDPDEIDEVNCPHCEGQGILGYDQHNCPFCDGACRISKDKADEYDPNKIDEVDCPRCAGNGILGVDQHYCPYCGGACYISKEKAKGYASAQIDEVDCPHCQGQGQSHQGRTCQYCKGACQITHDKAHEYDAEKIDEVECPHCHGSGSVGHRGNMCKYCQGEAVVSTEMREAYYNEYPERQ